MNYKSFAHNTLLLFPHVHAAVLSSGPRRVDGSPPLRYAAGQTAAALAFPPVTGACDISDGPRNDARCTSGGYGGEPVGRIPILLRCVCVYNTRSPDTMTVLSQITFLFIFKYRLSPSRTILLLLFVLCYSIHYNAICFLFRKSYWRLVLSIRFVISHSSLYT